MPAMIRVRAVRDLKVARVDENGATVMGRYVGREPDGSPTAEGVLVPEDSYHVRAIRRGELERVPENQEVKS